MRATGSELEPGEPQLAFTFEGQEVRARQGETIAAALAAQGILDLRMTREGEVRGLFCGMGICQECLVDIAGRPAERACMTKAVAGMAVTRHRTPAHIPAVPSVPEVPDIPRDPDVLVIGGGPAGLTAALHAACAGARVLLIDERPAPGGQYYKQPHGGLKLPPAADDTQFADGRGLIAAARAAGVVFAEGMVANATLPLRVTVIVEGAAVEIAPRRLIVATGAYERPLMVPGWTLPGVMTTGAAQTLLRSYRVLPGRRVVIAGNGPLNLQVAVELMRAGAEILAVAESAPAPGLGQIASLARMALAAPKLLMQGRGYLRELRRRGVPLHFSTTLKEIRPGLAVTLEQAGRPLEIACDALCMGYGFLPSNEVLRLLDCSHRFDPRSRHLVTERDALMRSTIPGVFAIGDCCGLSGARVALAEGIIACLTAAAEAMARPLAAQELEDIAGAGRERSRQLRFQSALWQLFAPATEPAAPLPDTIICRCEGVTFADIVPHSGGIGTLKRMTRLGMGRCQGRYCVTEAVGRLCRAQGIEPDAFAYAAPRAPVKPVPISALAAAGPLPSALVLP